MNEKFKVKGMHCASCEKLLKMEIGALPGIKSVRANAASGTVDVTGERFDSAAVRKAITENGYKVE